MKILGIFTGKTIPVLRWLPCVLLLWSPLILTAQKEMTLSLQACESLFVKNNLELLAGKFHVEAAHAEVIQARIWENPVATFGFNGYNPEKSRYLDMGTDGEKSGGLEQLIYLGGKKRNEVAMAQNHAEVAELELADLLWNLKYQLRLSYFGLYYQNLSYQALEKHLNNLDSLVVAYQVQVEKGNMPLKDLVRLQSLSLNFRNQKSELLKSILECRHNLVLLTGLSDPIRVQPEIKEMGVYQQPREWVADSLKAMALRNRIDLKIATKEQEISGLNLKLQRSLAVPDLTVGAAWDQRGGTFQNEVGITLGMPLPLWNRNQGNIKIAKAQLQESALGKQQKQLEVAAEVSSAFDKWKEALRSYQYLSKKSLLNLEEVQNGIFRNFRNGNVSMIEFTDFMESYHSTLIQYYQFGQNLVSASEELNLVTHSELFK
ncbi:MAG: TolC family protein [Marinilabiliales bacterium]|nr:TolC family protein [Marinilabiliales bacterium]